VKGSQTLKINSEVEGVFSQ